MLKLPLRDARRNAVLHMADLHAFASAQVVIANTCIRSLSTVFQAKTLNSFNVLLQQLKAQNKHELTVLLLGKPRTL